MYKEIEKLNCYLKKWGVDYSVYDYDAYTINELLMIFLKKINESIDTVNQYTKCIIALIDYVRNEGLKKEVEEAIDKLIENGTIDKIINENIFSDLNEKIDDNKKAIEVLNKALEDYKIKIDGTIDDIKENIKNEFVDIKEELENKFTELNEILNTKLNELDEQINYLKAIREVDLRELTPFTLGQFMSKKTRVVQGLGYNPKTNTFFISRVYSDESGKAESFLIGEYDTSGRQLSSCVCENGGHGTIFGVEPVYNPISNNYDSYIWTAWDVTNSNGESISYRVCRFKYYGTQVEGDYSIKLTDSNVQIFDIGTTEYTLVNINALYNIVCLVKKGDGTYKPEFHYMENIKAGDYNNPISKVSLNINDMYGLQGMCFDNDKLYWRRGDSNAEPDQVTVYDWRKNKELYNINLRNMSNPNKIGNEYMEGFKEPEGMALFQDERTKFRTFFFISSVGESGRRKAIIDCLSQNSVSCPAITSSTDNCQKIAITKPDGQVKDIPLKCNRLSDIREIGEYGLSSSEYTRMIDKPDSSGTDSSWRLWVSGHASSWDNTVLQTMIRNNAGHVDMYIRWARPTDVTDWYRVQTTRV